jgi:hypothetical protein
MDDFRHLCDDRSNSRGNPGLTFPILEAGYRKRQDLNPPHNAQKTLFLRIFGLPLLWIPIAAAAISDAQAAFSPDGEAALERMREKVSSGEAGQESYDALIGFLSESGEEGCDAWAESFESGELPDGGSGTRGREIRAVLAETCPEIPGKDGERGTGNMDDTHRPGPPDSGPGPGPGSGSPDAGIDPVPAGRRRAAWARFEASHSVRPRGDPDPIGQAPYLRAEAAVPGLSGTLSLRDYRPDLRYLRLGAGRVTLHAGHLHSALSETRLGFVAGSRFYLGWSGASGLGGALRSPRTALDGLGLRVRAGGWILETAGAWNRLRKSGEDGDAPRRDASMVEAGLARPSGSREDRPEIRLQACLQRFEPESGPPTEVAVAGAAVSGRAEESILWNLGLAGSWTRLRDSTGAVTTGGGEPFRVRSGGYLEASLASPDSQGSWRIEARQAGPGWANPLQSPRGTLRDTLDGRWPVPGDGEGGLSARNRFPVFQAGGYRADLQGRGAAGWSERGLWAGEGGLAVLQSLGEWTHETGSTLTFRRPGPPAEAGFPESGEELDWKGWGQALGWRRGPWQARAAVSWKGGGYSGAYPAPISLSCGRTGTLAWNGGLLIGNVEAPWDYARLELRQGWSADRRVRVEQKLRLPWTREGLASDAGYQLRLEAAL